jgi:hypothetical protein
MCVSVMLMMFVTGLQFAERRFGGRQLLLGGTCSDCEQCRDAAQNRDSRQIGHRSSMGFLSFCTSAANDGARSDWCTRKGRALLRFVRMRVGIC